jgi:CBS domain containing-hemolysin-like protein
MVGATAGELYGDADISLAGFTMSYESIIAAGMTLAILLLSEIIPKTIGANNWRELSPFTVKTLRIILFLLAPFVWMSQLITRSLKKEKNKAVLTRSDFTAMTELGITEGVLEKSESTIINNVLNFENVIVRDIMTPRSVTFMMNQSSTIDDYLREKESTVHSRVPIFEDEKDNVTGVVLKDDLLAAKGDGKGAALLLEYKRDVVSISDATPLPKFMKLAAKDKQHIHIVSDEFGHMLGIVTMEDLIETLLGTEIIDESDVVVDLQKHARDEWEKKNKGGS